MQDGVGLGQVKNMSVHDNHSMIPVDGTDLIKIIQSKISSAGHLIITRQVPVEQKSSMCMMCLKYRIILLIVIKNPWVHGLNNIFHQNA